MNRIRKTSSNNRDTNPYSAALDLPPVRNSSVRQALEKALLHVEHESGRHASDISVTLLCKRAHVARSTFYANYHTTDDVQRQIELRVLHTIITDGSTLTRTGTEGAAEAFTRVTQLAQNNEALFRLLVVEAPDERFIHDWQQALCAHLWDRLFGQHREPHTSTSQHRPPSTVNRHLVVEMTASLMISFITYRLEHPGEVSMEEVNTRLPWLINLLDQVW